MSQYVLSPAARVDLEQIWDYSSERWDDDQTEEYLREIQRAIERLVSNPTIGRACDDVPATASTLSDRTLFITGLALTIITGLALTT